MRPSCRLTAAIVCLAVGLPACAVRYEAIPPGQTKVVQVAAGREPGDSTLCLFRVPEGYDPARPWPMVVALHGYGSDAEPFLDLWQDAAAARGAVLAVPRGNLPTAEGVGRAWGGRSRELVRRSVDGVRSLVNVDPARIRLVGFSQGGGVALNLGLEHPRVFAGVALLGTAFGTDRLTRIGLAAPRDGQRVYIGRGSLEPDPEGAEAAAEAFRRLGCTAELSVYPGVGHGLPDPMEPELDRILGFLLEGN